MKPRIVRANRYWGDFLGATDSGHPYLALPWPESCPYTPEQVMAACERSQEQWCGIPVPNSGEWWIAVGFLEWRRLTPEFIGEPKCEHPMTEGSPSSHPAPGYRKCASCGAILSDRRYYTQRKGERRKVGKLYGGGRRRINTSLVERRTGKDRRRP